MIVVGNRGNIFHGRRMYSVIVNEMYVPNIVRDSRNKGLETKIRGSGDREEPVIMIV